MCDIILKIFEKKTLVEMVVIEFTKFALYSYVVRVLVLKYNVMSQVENNLSHAYTVALYATG